MKKILQIACISFCFASLTMAAKTDTSKVEWIKVYFNAVSDHSFAIPKDNVSNDNWDMIQMLVDRIDSAQFSVDLVAYDLQNMLVGHALANAARRGLRVRVVTDVIHRNHAPKYTQPIWDTLRSAGIYNIDDSGTIYNPDGKIEKLDQKLPNSGSNMHHKYAVIDALSEDPNDDYVFTGSMNFTYTGPWNTNTTLVIKDSGIAAAYFEEFEQLWGSDTAIPNAHRALFHKDKKNVSTNIHYVDSIKVEVYFGPIDRYKTKPSISARITELIQEYALHDVRFLAFAISPNINISQALINRSARGEITLEGVIDPAFYGRYRNNGAIWAQPVMTFGNRHVVPGNEVRKLHSKTMIIDAEYQYPEKHKAVTIVGSYNFSANAEKSNDENILMIYDNTIANQYLQDFKGIMNRADKKSDHRHPEIDTSQWYSNFRIGRNGGLEVELVTNFYYPVSLLGVDMPRIWAGHEDSSYYHAQESQDYLRKIIRNSELKITAGNEIPSHRYGRYSGYITARNDTGLIEVNHQLIATGNAAFSKYNRQQRDSIMSFKYVEKAARKNKIGMWASPDSVGTKILTEEAEKLKNLFPLDLNSAQKKELTLIPSIGPKTAALIIDYRDKRGDFKSINELRRIRGIGPATVEKLEKYLIIGDKEE